MWGKHCQLWTGSSCYNEIKEEFIIHGSGLESEDNEAHEYKWEDIGEVYEP